jgi:hypothetical protein
MIELVVIVLVDGNVCCYCATVGNRLLLRYCWK